MAATNVNRPGEIDATGDPHALFLKLFSGEVLTEFEEKTVMRSRQTVRTIMNGKVAQFPVLGTASAGYFTPGDNILEDGSYLGTIRHGERLIAIDKLLISALFLAEIDELMNHYEVRQAYASELGQALARQFDEHSMVVLAIGAADAGGTAFTGAKGGNAVTGTNLSTDVSVLKDGIFEMAELMDEKDVPEEGRVLILPPKSYYQLINDDQDAIDIDYNPGGNGSFASGTVFRIAGFEIVKSNRVNSLPDLATSPYTANQPAGAGTVNSYAFDASATVALALHPTAIGAVELIGPRTVVYWSEPHQGWLLLAKYAVGHGVLRPECCGSFENS